VLSLKSPNKDSPEEFEMQDIQDHNMVEKPESGGDESQSQPDAGAPKACSLKSCSLTSPKSLSFLLPFIGVMLLDYFAVGPFCGGSVCHTCVWTKSALAGLAGIVGLWVYSRVAKGKKTA
jgi:hypothetical protein